MQVEYTKMQAGEIIKPGDEYYDVSWKKYELSIGKPLKESNVKNARRPLSLSLTDDEFDTAVCMLMAIKSDDVPLEDKFEALRCIANDILQVPTNR